MRSIKIEQIGSKNFGEIESFIEGYHFKPYYYLKQLKEEYKIKLFNTLLFNTISRLDNFLFAAKNKNKYAGFILLERQEWDSEFFGYDCYKIDHIFATGDEKTQIKIKKSLVEYINNVCLKIKIRHLNVRTDTKDITNMHALETKGFSLLSTTLHFSYFSKQPRRHFKKFGKIRDYQQSDLVYLREIARDSMKYDHFHTDIHLLKETSDNVYVNLIENCCKGVNADKVFVVEKRGKIVGYVACQIRQYLNKILPITIGHIRHLAVLSPEGFGCGPGLQEAALSWLEKRVDIIESATTVQNLPIIRISLHSGMEIVYSYLMFSKWL